jgi:porin
MSALFVVRAMPRRFWFSAAIPRDGRLWAGALVWLVAIALSPHAGAQTYSVGDAFKNPAAAESMASPILDDPLADLQNWLAQPTMTGDWGGARTKLQDNGINWQTWLTAEPVRNFNGYKGVTTAWADTLAWGADVDLGKFYDVDPGGTFRIWMTKRDGRNPGTDKIGSFFQTQETYGQGRDFRLNEISLAQAFWDNIINVKGGFYPLGKDFGSLPAFCNYISNAYCGHPLTMPYDSGWDDDPSGRYGGRIRISPMPTLYFQTGIFQVNPTIPQEGNGWKLGWNGNTGVQFPTELMWQPSTDPRYTGIYKIGGYEDTSKVPDQFDPAKRDKGREGYYFEMQQKVWSETANPNRGLSISGFDAVGDQNTAELKQTYHFGLSYKGTFEGRDLDTVNFGWVAAYANPRLVAYERLNGKPQQSATENQFELNYNIVLGPWLQVRPGLEYDTDPSGYASRPNALVLALSVKIIL